MTPAKRPAVREPRTRQLQVRVSEREYKQLEQRFLTAPYDSARSFSDWLRSTLLRDAKA